MSKKLFLVLFFVVALLPGQPVLAVDFSEGFGEESVEQYSKSARARTVSPFMSEAERANYADFVIRAGLFRLSMIGGNTGILGDLSAVEEKSINALYQDGSKLEKDLWKHFFEGSTIFVGNAKAGTKRVGYHNAFVDGWVLTNWKKDGETYRLTGLTTRTGEALSGRKAQEYAPWLTGNDKPLVVTFYENSKKNGAAFKQKYPEFSASEPGNVPAFDQADYRILKNRLRVAGVSIVSMADNDDYNRVLSTFLKANIEGDTSRIKKLVKDKKQIAPLERLAMQPAEIRSSQRLMNVARRGEEEYTALYASPIRPDQIMFVDIRPDGNQKPELAQVLIVNMKQ